MPAVDRDEPEADQQDRAEAAQQPAQPVGVLRPDGGGLVDLGSVRGGRQGLDLGEQFGCRGHTGDRGVPLLLLADPQLGRDAALRVELGVQLLLEGAVVLGAGLGARRPVAGRGAAQLVGVGEEAAVERGGALQLRVGADRGELPAVQDGDAVGELEGGAAVGDEERRTARHHLLEGLVDLVLDAGVDG